MRQQDNLKIITAIENTDYLKKVVDNISRMSNTSVLAYTRNSTDIIDLCSALSPDILICDVSGENGRMSTVIKKICNNQQHPPFHVIATAFSKEGEAYISDSIQNGADLFMENLDNPDILRSTLKIISRHTRGNLDSESLKFDLHLKTDEILHNLKLPVHYTGYYFFRSALILTATRETKLPDVSCKLYAKIAEEFETTPRQVERAICKAVNHINSVCQKEYIFRTILGYSVNTSNYTLNAKELIALIADQLRLNYISL